VAGGGGGGLTNKLCEGKLFFICFKGGQIFVWKIR
jgi:hypothetical protein